MAKKAKDEEADQRKEEGRSGAQEEKGAKKSDGEEGGQEG